MNTSVVRIVFALIISAVPTIAGAAAPGPPIVCFAFGSTSGLDARDVAELSTWLMHDLGDYEVSECSRPISSQCKREPACVKKMAAQLGIQHILLIDLVRVGPKIDFEARSLFDVGRPSFNAVFDRGGRRLRTPWRWRCCHQHQS